MNRKAGGTDLIIIIFLLKGDKSNDPEQKDQDKCSGYSNDYLCQWNLMPEKDNVLLFSEESDRNAQKSHHPKEDFQKSAHRLSQAQDLFRRKECHLEKTDDRIWKKSQAQRDDCTKDCRNDHEHRGFANTGSNRFLHGFKEGPVDNGKEVRDIE